MDQSFEPPRNSRFTENPFREPNLASAQVIWREKRNRAIRLFRETGDSTLAEEIGLFWNEADEKRARAAQRLRFSDNPFQSGKLTNKEMAARFGPVLEKRNKDTIKNMVTLFKPIQKPHVSYRGMKGPLLTSEGREARAGDELWIDGFMSTSRHPGFAAECALHEFGDGYILIEIRPAPEAETITLDNEVNGRREYETIFNVGQKVRVEKAITDFRTDTYPLNKASAYYVATLTPGV